MKLKTDLPIHLSLAGRVARALYEEASEDDKHRVKWSDLPHEVQFHYDCLACAAIEASGYRALQIENEQLRDAVQTHMRANEPNARDVARRRAMMRVATVAPGSEAGCMNPEADTRDLQEKVADIIFQSGTFSSLERPTVSRLTLLYALADQILALPEIDEALTSLARAKGGQAA